MTKRDPILDVLDDLHGVSRYYFQGGPRRDSAGMAKGAAALRDEGKLPAEASLIFTQLLLNLAGHVGRERAEKLIGAFLDAADVRRADG